MLLLCLVLLPLPLPLLPERGLQVPHPLLQGELVLLELLGGAGREPPTHLLHFDRKLIVNYFL